MQEVWKNIEKYKGIYQVSNLGRVRKTNKEGFFILKNSKSKHSRYLRVSLWLKNKGKTFYIHKLVAMAFLNHTPCGYKLVIDHIDNNPLNNKVENLQLISHRKNISKEKKGKSKYTGVSWHKPYKKWRALIRIGKIRKHLGYFEKEYDAYLAYQKALKSLT